MKNNSVFFVVVVVIVMMTMMNFLYFHLITIQLLQNVKLQTKKKKIENSNVYRSFFVSYNNFVHTHTHTQTQTSKWKKMEEMKKFNDKIKRETKQKKKIETFPTNNNSWAAARMIYWIFFSCFNRKLTTMYTCHYNVLHMYRTHCYCSYKVFGLGDKNMMYNEINFFFLATKESWIESIFVLFSHEIKISKWLTI